MERHTFYADTPWLLLCVSLMALVWAFLQLPPGMLTGGTPTPTPTPELAAGSPKCQQDNEAQPAGTRFPGPGETEQYAQVVPDLTDRHYDRVVTDDLLLNNRFDAGSVGPIVFHPDGTSFAFIAAQNGQKYILAYGRGSLTPYVAERVRDVWNNWVCFGATGKYLFAIAGHNEQWHLDVRPEQARANFTHYLLNGDPGQLEILPVRANGVGELEYAPVDAAVRAEINSWLK